MELSATQRARLQEIAAEAKEIVGGCLHPDGRPKVGCTGFCGHSDCLSNVASKGWVAARETLPRSRADAEV